MACSPEECAELTDAINFASEMAGYHGSLAAYETDLAAFYAAQAAGLQAVYNACECTAARPGGSVEAAPSERQLRIRRSVVLTALRCDMRRQQMMVETIERLI